ncbi:hypothetical protein ACFY7C_37070 [Streptomyces sp. NPDC012769]|uniref:hypothetical protein n=1 Tax=Streptomyces sp. NPDC012769 TaxID=3364848 RepID=UPI0036C74904
MDWFDDERLDNEIKGMTSAQRHQAAYLALRRLRGPLLGLPIPQEWGITPEVLQGVLDAGGARLDGEPSESLHHAVADLVRAPVFAGKVDFDPDDDEIFLLEVMSSWIVLEGALGGMGEDLILEMINRARQLSNSIDVAVEASLPISGEASRREYIRTVDNDLARYGLEYFGTRNIEIERECHRSILASSGRDLGAREGEVLTLCDEFSR